MFRLVTPLSLPCRPWTINFASCHKRSSCRTSYAPQTCRGLRARSLDSVVDCFGSCSEAVSKHA